VAQSKLLSLNLFLSCCSTLLGVFGWLQADTVAAVWIAAAAIHREKNTVQAAATAGLQPQRTRRFFSPSSNYSCLSGLDSSRRLPPLVVSSDSERNKCPCGIGAVFAFSGPHESTPTVPSRCQHAISPRRHVAACGETDTGHHQLITYSTVFFNSRV
jgi:hypothetical protein